MTLLVDETHGAHLGDVVSKIQRNSLRAKTCDEIEILAHINTGNTRIGTIASGRQTRFKGRLPVQFFQKKPKGAVQGGARADSLGCGF